MAAIRITNSDPETGNLTMIDSKGHSACNFHVAPKDVVTWEIQSGSGVMAITEISPKENNTNLFSSGPRKLPGSAINWQGTISEHPIASQEFYLIEWTDDKDKESHTYDPLIQLNPPFKIS
jgi:hypothetical protein